MRLFLDDKREPPNDGQDWVVVRSVHDASVQALAAYMNDIPLEFISFDNDLGENQPEGRHFANWLVEKDMEYPGFLPGYFDFYVHSQNPVARAYIEDYLGSYLEQRGSYEAD